MAHHEFSPTHYHTTIGWHDPVLEIDSGDTVATTTVDARGRDHTGERVTPRGNPQTGPFYVRGAEEGDTLVVRFDQLTPNRPWGWTGGQVAAHVVDPGFHAVFSDAPQPTAKTPTVRTTTKTPQRSGNGNQDFLNDVVDRFIAQTPSSAPGGNQRTVQIRQPLPSIGVVCACLVE